MFYLLLLIVSLGVRYPKVSLYFKDQNTLKFPAFFAFVCFALVRAGLQSRWFSATVVDELRDSLGKENVATSVAVLEQHDHDESWHRGGRAQAVVFPQSTDDVSKIAQCCSRHRVAMVPFGTGTGLEGGVTTKVGVCVLSDIITGSRRHSPHTFCAHYVQQAFSFKRKRQSSTVSCMARRLSRHPESQDFLHLLQLSPSTDQ